MATRVALVTGANQGIGLQIVRELCKKFNGIVLLTARNVQRGEAAKALLETEGLRPLVVELDVDSMQSIRDARNTVEEKYGGRVDVLINNAAVLFRENSGKSFYEKASQTIETNYHGLLNVINIFSPLLQPNSRVVNMSSMLGRISRIMPGRQKAILDPNLTIEKLTSLMDEFVKDAQGVGDHEPNEWTQDKEYGTYTVSKAGVSRLTELLVDTIGKDPAKPGILINSVHPGWVRTQLGTMAASLSVEEGADSAVYLSLLPPGASEPNGLFIQNRVPVNWK